jgi:hypothetical protein
MDGRYLTQFACSSFFWKYTIISTAILQRVHILPNWRTNPTTWKDWHVPQKKETVECWEVTIWSNSHLFTCQTHVIVMAQGGLPVPQFGVPLSTVMSRYGERTVPRLVKDMVVYLYKCSKLLWFQPNSKVTLLASLRLYHRILFCSRQNYKSITVLYPKAPLTFVRERRILPQALIYLQSSRSVCLVRELHWKHTRWLDPCRSVHEIDFFTKYVVAFFLFFRSL